MTTQRLLIHTCILAVLYLLCACVCVCVQIVDAEGREVGTNEEGEIALRVKPHRPVGLFSGYYVCHIFD